MASYGSENMLTEHKKNGLSTWKIPQIDPKLSYPTYSHISLQWTILERAGGGVEMNVLFYANHPHLTHNSI